MFARVLPTLTDLKSHQDSDVNNNKDIFLITSLEFTSDAALVDSTISQKRVTIFQSSHWKLVLLLNSFLQPCVITIITAN